MDGKKFTHEEEFDWSLHMLQLPLSCSSQLSTAYKISQRRYVAAMREPGGMGLHQDMTLLQQYCTALDGQGPEESNHAALIMLAIKHLLPDNSKWKCHLTGEKMKGFTQSHKSLTDDKSYSRPSPDKLENLLAKLKNPRPSKHSKAKDEVGMPSNPSAALKEQSRPFISDDLSTSATTNARKSINCSSAQDDRERYSDASGQNQYAFSRMNPPSDSFKQKNNNILSGTCHPSRPGEQRNYYSGQNQLGNEEPGHTSDLSSRDYASARYDSNQREQNSDFHSNQNLSVYFNHGTHEHFPPSNSASRDFLGNQQMQQGNVRDFHGQHRSQGFPALPSGSPAGGRGAVGGRGTAGRYPWQRGRRATAATPSSGCFKTASHQLALNQARQHSSNSSSNNSNYNSSSYNPNSSRGQQQCGGVRSEHYGSGRSLGLRPSVSVSSKFVPPIRRDEAAAASNFAGDASAQDAEAGPYAELMADPRMKNIEAKMVELIMNEVLDSGLDVGWDDIAGLQQAKDTIQEVVVWPMLRPDIFTGLRGPPKGVLLFGPPGTGKTMIGKAIASQSGATFFSISASCLTSKWVGEGEKMVRALFAVARVQSPSVIFIDEIDSLLCQRSETEHESSRRIKTEFLVQLDGVGAVRERVLVVGATNRPQELDEAARRRLQKRLYIPLPDEQARVQLVSKLLSGQQHTLTPADMTWVATQTDGYSGADVAAVCSDAAMGPVRSISAADMRHIALHQVRAISFEDFRASVRSVRPSVCEGDLQHYCDWNKQYGIAAAIGTTQ